MTMFIYGILVGIGATMLILELRSTITAYKDRQQAEFEAAVQAAAAHRRNQAEKDWDAMLDGVTDTKPSNVRKFEYDKLEDPFA